ncbi:enoyl-CoA hydratase-related protein [Alkalicoccus halolimnae]|uniref:Enoyl-CoA hydratase-related protein n=1 Tax=Alkalicoccus halolimnae TaxID=1667239 RepID=A0A5C7FP85_9BACI|nr:enoyl-CoA hydratase-related protein [Alkalicoccus halolimnae]TXF86555.1 enoyl-CoA hydratase [Alkalicoccus halolimnae]
MIKTNIAEGTAVLTLDRPEAANALSRQLLAEAGTVLQNWRENSEIKAVVITGSGEKVFCAGADLKERAEMKQEEVWEAVQAIRSFVETVYSMPQPVICSLNGSAIGGGLELALACDFRIAQEGAVFALAETGLGIIPGAGGTQRLPRLIGEQRAKEMILAGRKYDACEAEKAGLLLKTVPAGQLQKEASSLAEAVASRAPLANKYAKAAVNKGLQLPLEEALEAERKEYKKTIATEDRLEGLQAFKEKRKPVFRGL